MGFVMTLIDAVLFLFFLLTAIVVPLLDAQKVIPAEYYPKKLLDLNAWYATEYGDYLISDSPHFFVGLIWNELLLLCPLAIANLVALLSAKSWYNKTCLIFGASYFTSMAAIMGELLGSGRASDKLLKIYSPFMVLAALTVLRGGLMPYRRSSGNSGGGKRSVLSRKKRA